MKRVLVTVQGRKIPFPINPKDGQSEYDCLDSEFKTFASADPYLSNKLQSTFPTYHYFDDDFQEYVQVVPTCQILPHNILKVEFSNLSSPKKNQSQQVPPGQSQYLSLNDVVVEYVAEAGKEDNLYEFANFSQPIAMDEQQPSTSRGDGQMQLVEIPPEQHSSLEVEKQPEAKDSESLPLDFSVLPLPSFSAELLNQMETGEVLEDASQLVKEAGDHLRSFKAKPTPKDYTNYLTHLFANFPKLDVEMQADETLSFGDVIRLMLITYVKNKRRNRKTPPGLRKRCSVVAFRGNREQRNKEKRSAETSPISEGVEKKRKLSTQKEAEVFDGTQPMMSLTKKKFVPNAVIQHLPTFTTERRAKIKEFENLLDVIKAWPVFGNADVIIAEFFNTCGLSQDRVYANFEQMIARLEVIYDKKAANESDKLSLLYNVESELQINVSKKWPRAFSVEKLGNLSAKPKLPSQILANGPVSASYVTTEGAISKCFLLASTKCICSKVDVRAFDVYCLVVGAYYTFDRSYPNVTKSLYDFLDHAVLNTNNQNLSPKLTIFKKKYFQSLQQGEIARLIN